MFVNIFYWLCLQESLEASKTVYGSTEITEEQYEDFLKHTGISLDERYAHMDFHVNNSFKWISNYIQFCKTIPGFNQLDMSDKCVLIKRKFYC